MHDTDTSKITVRVPEGAILIAERIESGHAIIEVVQDGELLNRDVLDASQLRENVHDGQVIVPETDTDGNRKFAPALRESAERERAAQESAESLSLPLSEVTDES